MATIQDINSGSNYTGDAALGGGFTPSIPFDTKPLDNLAAYTMLYNKEVWRQKQYETDQKVAQLADLSNISLNDLRSKDKVQATKEFSTLLQKASEYARKVPKTPQERIQNELDWQTEYGKFKNNFNSGKQRAVSYAAHYNTIKQNVPNAATQNEAIRQLDRSFDETDIGTPISAVPNFKVEKFNIPEPVSQQFSTVAIGTNDTTETKGKIYYPLTNAGVADASLLAINKASIKQGTPEYEALSQNEKDQADIQATVDSEGKGWISAVIPLNEIFKNPKYKKEDGTFNYEKFESENASDLTLMSSYNAIKNASEYSKQKKQEALNGVFNDKGVQYALPQNIKPQGFDSMIVDFTSGVTPNQLMQSGMFAKWKGDEFTKDSTYTGAENKKKDLSLEWFKAKTGRISATRPYSGESGGGGKAPDTLTQPALIFGEHINRLKGFFNKHTGKDELMVSASATDAITKKALGLDENDKKSTIIYKRDGTAIINPTITKNGWSGGTPLTIEQQKNNFIIAVKGGSKDEAVLDAKFLGDAEAGMNSIFGTTSGTAIWNNWGVTPTAKAAESTTTEPAKSTGGMTDAQFQEYLKKKGLK